EVSPYIFDPGMGVYTFNAVLFNQDVWDGLSDNHKRIFEEVVPEFLPKYIEANNSVEDNACTEFLASGATVTLFSEADKQRWKDMLGDSLLDKWKQDV